MAARKRITKRVRFEIFKRDRFRCQYCGAHPPDAILHVDHIVPVAGGGDNEDGNLVTACAACNIGKGAVSLAAVPESLAQRARIVREREEQLRGYAEVMARQKERIEDDAWRVASLFCRRFYGENSIRQDWLRSIKAFNERLGAPSVEDAMERTLDRDIQGHARAFRYFCGICWARIREEDL